MAATHGREVLPRVVGAALLRCRCTRRRGPGALLDDREQLPLLDRIADVDRKLADDPSTSAITSCSIFIASMMTTASPGLIRSPATCATAITVPVNGASTRVCEVVATT
jgi:hypothetical protein